MVSLTSLLVLATFFSQTNKSIPRTSYLKLLDVWYLALISLTVLMIVSHVFLENIRLSFKHRMQESKKKITTVLPGIKKPSSATPLDTNSAGNDKYQNVRTRGVATVLPSDTTTLEALKPQQTDTPQHQTNLIGKFIDDKEAAKRINTFLRTGFLLALLVLPTSLIFATILRE